MPRLIMKFGGTSVGDIERIRNVAAHVQREVDAGHQVAVVVSAMSGETNRLVGLTRDVARLHDAREYDVVVSAGEQVSVGLLAMALQDLGVAARSWLGWQIAMKTSDVHGAARIKTVDVAAMEDLERVRHLFADLDRQKELVSLLSEAETGNGVKIFIGAQTPLFSLSGSSLIIGPYQDDSRSLVGVVGVIAPTRTDYARLIPMVDHTAKLVSDILSRHGS